MASSEEVGEVCGSILRALDSTEARALQFREQFMRFSHLWTKQPAASLQVGTRDCKSLHCFVGAVARALDCVSHLQEFLERKGPVESGARRDPPLSEFEAEIARYRAIQSEIMVG